MRLDVGKLADSCGKAVKTKEISADITSSCRLGVYRFLVS